VKCLIQIYINFTSEFDCGHGPLVNQVHRTFSPNEGGIAIDKVLDQF